MCGVKADGTLWCWGSNTDGQLGDGTTSPRLVPTQVGAATDWVDVSAGDYHTCATRRTGGVFCWGNNLDGQVGDGTFVSRSTPTQVLLF
jgi:alpha-tubulin suppressor-like RCC1 family protein